MVPIDLSSPAVRKYFEIWLADHRQKLYQIEQQMHVWALQAMSSGPGKPLAVVFDIDEVLLCNVRTARDPATDPAADPHHVEDSFGPPVKYPAEHSHLAKDRKGSGDPSRWPRDHHWAHATASKTGYNPILPGAKDLVETCHSLNLTVFLVTGRLEALRKETAENLEMVGLIGPETGLHRNALENPDPEHTRLYMCPAGPAAVGRHKTRARAKIAETYHIVANIGDQLSDLGEHGDQQLLLGHSFYHTA